MEKLASSKLIIVTGMSGAGRSTIAHALEDLGWYVVDNLPPTMINKLVDESRSVASKIAVVVDVRGRHTFEHLSETLESLKKNHIQTQILFVDSSDEVLVKRFESTRRPHPLQGDGVISDGIARERKALLPVRGLADMLIDSSALNIHQLSLRVNEMIATEDENRLKVNVLSFGYKYGAPIDADLVVDCRFIPNPHWKTELRPLTGLDNSVKQYVLNSPNVPEFVDRYLELLQIVAQGFFNEGRKFLTIAVGCTGGKHRSVAIAHEIGERLNQLKKGKSGEISAHVIDRDVAKES